MQRSHSLSVSTRKNITSYFVDTSTIVLECQPLFAAYEVFIAGMSDSLSLHARVTGALCAFAGVGYFYGKGRDLSRGFFHIDSQSSERIQQGYDFLYGAGFNLVYSPFFYFLAGSRDVKEIALGCLGAVGIGAVNGAPMGFALDIARDLTGIKDCERKYYPAIIKKQSSGVKKGIALAFVAASFASVATMYALSSDTSLETLVSVEK